MRNFISPFLLPLLLLLTLLVGCDRSSNDLAIAPAESGASRLSSHCTTFQYSDTLFFYREQATPYVESPTTAQTGAYGAFPNGLNINATTGAIDVNASLSGLKYRVWFVKAGTSDTCTRFVTISGVDFASRLYQLPANETIASPFYNANRLAGSPCGDDDDDDDEEEEDDDDEEEDDDDCEFDDGDDDDDGDGLGDEPPSGQEVIPQGIAIDKQTGMIDLRQTVNNGTFGANPVNGTSKTVRIYYRLNDASNRALNYVDVTLHWYATLAQVPAALLADVAYKNSATLRRATLVGPRLVLPDGFLRAARPARPPDIILVGR